MEPLLTEDPCI